MKKNIFIYLMVGIFCIIPCFAEDITNVGQRINLYSDALTQIGYYTTVNANITIYLPNGSISVLNAPMTQLKSGLFLYNYTPNTTGQYYTATVYGNSTGLIGISTATFTVTGLYSMYIAIIIALIATIAYFIYLGKDLMNKPMGNQDQKGAQKWLNTQTVGLFVYMLSSWLILALFFVMYQFTIGTAVENFFSILFSVFLWVIPLANIAYWTFYIIFLIMNSLKRAIRIRK